MNNDEEKNYTSDMGEFRSISNKIFKQYIYYLIMFLASVIVLGVAPFLGSTANLESNFPNTAAGWIVWITIRIMMAVINVVIFYCFMQQGKLNIKDDPKFLEAKRILAVENTKQKPPRNPKTWEKNAYIKKALIIIVATLIAGIGISQAIISYDYIALISYIFTILMGLIFGLIQMKNAEFYWTDEYYEYALYIQNKKQEKGDVVNDRSKQ